MKAEDVLERLRLNFEYDPQTGLFTRLVDSKNGKKGDVQGNKESNYYIRIRLGKKTYSAHRLAFLYMSGEWPKGLVDHRDLDKTNNKWENLRDSNSSVNKRNVDLQKNNKSGVVGVRLEETGKWYAYIYAEGRLIALGRFEYKEDAIFARMTAEKKYGFWRDRVWDQL